MIPRDLLLALLLPLPPWLGFWVFRLKGRVGLSYGYFLGGILALLAMPWTALTSRAIPSAQLGGALFGFSLFFQAHREGRTGIRRMAVGVGGASLFAWALGSSAGVPMGSLALFWGTGILSALVWLGLSDLGYRVAKGKYLELRLPAVGALSFLLTNLAHRFLPLGGPVFSWPSSLVAGALLGLVALHQLRWLRSQGDWVEGRGDGFRVALSALESDLPPAQPALAYRIEAQQPIVLVDGRGMIFEANEAFAREVGLQRHQIRGFELEGVLQGRTRGVWGLLRQQLLQQAHASASASLVRADGTFRDLALEGVAFDRNMALLWIADPSPGTLAVRSREQAGLFLEAGSRREALVNALGTLLPATDQLLAEPDTPDRAATAGLARAAALKLSALLGRAQETEAQAPLDPLPILEGLRPRLGPLLSSDQTLELQCGVPNLLVGADVIERLVIQLFLHARQGGGAGPIILRLDPVHLGGRPWALLQVQPPGAEEPAAFLGISWLQREVGQARGMLELVDSGGGIHPLVYLPAGGPGFQPSAEPLLGRSVWILEPDPLLREALGGLVRQALGHAEAFPTLGALLKASRTRPLPDLLVLERHPRLERLHGALKRLGVSFPPTLLLGSGELLPPGGLATTAGKVGHLEKPFFGPEFIQSLLALLDPPAAG
ncbi:MAG: hypothetical protein HY823_09685 [Acidobacteria bacterium]|nr:hypothetical protein [Acidobacteriota bacterium]